MSAFIVPPCSPNLATIEHHSVLESIIRKPALFLKLLTLPMLVHRSPLNPSSGMATEYHLCTTWKS
jgi:hypothetical protein